MAYQGSTYGAERTKATIDPPTANTGLSSRTRGNATAATITRTIGSAHAAAAGWNGHLTPLVACPVARKLPTHRPSCQMLNGLVTLVSRKAARELGPATA